eukprot:10518280-Lingulodinium_polyedra.AAC.1
MSMRMRARMPILARTLTPALRRTRARARMLTLMLTVLMAFAMPMLMLVMPAKTTLMRLQT